MTVNNEYLVERIIYQIQDSYKFRHHVIFTISHCCKGRKITAASFWRIMWKWRKSIMVVFYVCMVDEERIDSVVKALSLSHTFPTFPHLVSCTWKGMVRVVWPYDIGGCRKKHEEPYQIARHAYGFRNLFYVLTYSPFFFPCPMVLGLQSKGH